MIPAVIYSRTHENAEKFASKQGILEAVFCTSLEELSRHPAAEAVYIASPTSLHCGQAVQMLKGGKHVLCEKPAASNYKEWEQMLAAAQRENRVIMEAMRPLFTPGFAVLKQNLYRVGKVRKVFLQYCQYSSRYDNYKKGIIENAFRPEFSNGALMDIGIYCIEVLTGLFGRPERITADSVILPGSIDGEGTILAGYPDMQAVLSYSKISGSGLPCEIQGEEGTLVWEEIRFPENIRFISRNGDSILLYEKTPVPDMAYEQREFIRLCSSGDCAEAYNQITSESLKIADEARRQCGIIFPADQNI